MTESTLRRLLAPSLSGLRKNLIPGLILQACALAVVVTYWISPSFHALLDQVGAIKSEFGYLYSALATGFFGGFLPFLVLRGTGQIPRGRALAELLFYVAFWAWKGAEVDALYRLQGALFGESATVSAIAAKTCVDQFLYNPLWAGPTQVLFFLWKDAGFSAAGVKEGLSRESLLSRVGVILLSTWMVWIPTVTIVYSLPSSLQIPIFNLVLCFWCLQFSFISRTSSRA